MCVCVGGKGSGGIRDVCACVARDHLPGPPGGGWEFSEFGDVSCRVVDYCCCNCSCHSSCPRYSLSYCHCYSHCFHFTGTPSATASASTAVAAAMSHGEQPPGLPGPPP